ncbi:Os11g0417350 [Oryza sativa Japonica Group]|uniref:Os11g0417350 protein n=1 Tax=Oryza sativa subsp. japonica TaxID=39947 RepID=A0A0N7KSU2_ORYSJ|nr:Os11g0417350 [Oryza sativa Japonica Group]
MASWLVPFFPCRVNRQATFPAPLPAILPGASSSLLLPPPPFTDAAGTSMARCSAVVRHVPIDSARTTSCRQSRHPPPPPSDGDGAVATGAAVIAAVLAPLWYSPAYKKPRPPPSAPLQSNPMSPRIFDPSTPLTPTSSIPQDSISGRTEGRWRFLIASWAARPTMTRQEEDSKEKGKRNGTGQE